MEKISTATAISGNHRTIITPCKGSEIIRLAKVVKIIRRAKVESKNQLEKMQTGSHNNPNGRRGKQNAKKKQPQNNPKTTPNVNDNDNVNVNDNVNDNINMELKELIKEVIDGISDAVIEEQQKWYPERKAVNGELNPLISPKDASRTKPETVKVHFDVSLVTRETRNSDGNVSTRLAVFSAGGGASSGKSDELVQRISFDIPMYLPH